MSKAGRETPQHITLMPGIELAGTLVVNNAPVFQLLVPSSQPGPFTIEIVGQFWELHAEPGLPGGKGNYTCLSYACGDAFGPHPFDPTQSLPARTLAAAATLIENETPEALWVDAFCVPFQEPERSACLSQLGTIYAMAARVVVVLSEECFEVLRQTRDSGHIDSQGMEILERDEWVSRVWTYQELANNSQIRFVAEGRGEVWSDANALLRDVAEAIEHYQKEHSYTSFDFAARFPRVTGLETLILDWKIADYLERSVYQVITSMDHRRSRTPEDFYLAMIGTIQPAGAAPSVLTLPGLAEHFLEICEANGDYSFIYTVAERDRTPGRGWRPLPGERLRTILPWHCFGDGQSATVHADGIELDRMWVVEPGVIGEDAEQLIFSWLLKGQVDADPAAVLAQLRKLGFAGSGEFLETKDGYLFTLGNVPGTGELLVAIATGVRMTLGAPAVLLEQVGEKKMFRGVGVFIGRVPTEGTSVRLIA